MYVEFEKGTMFVYTCDRCGYRRPGMLDHPMYSTRCPECGNTYTTTAIPAKNMESAKTNTQHTNGAMLGSRNSCIHAGVCRFPEDGMCPMECGHYANL